MRQMSLNARPSEGYGSRIQQKEGALSRVKADFDRSLSVGRGREDLFAGSGRQSDWGRQDALMRDGMNVHRSRLDGASDNLSRAHQMAEETNEIGVNALNDLRRQREQLVTAKGGMDQIEVKTSAARRILGVMRRRVIGNKLILGFIIFVLLLGNALIIYFRWGYKKSSGKTPSAPVAAPRAAPVNPPPVAVAVPIKAPVSVSVPTVGPA